MGKENPLQNLPAIVLCGGHGTRLKEETGDGHPKPLVPVEPSTALVEASIAQVETGGTSHIIFATSARIVNPLRKQLRLNWDNHPKGMLFSVEDEPKGVVEAVKQAIEEGKLHDRNFLSVHADELVPRINLPAMLKQHYRTGTPITELVTNHPDAGNNYVIWLDSTRKVVKLKRHPDQWQMVGGYTATGFFIFSPDNRTDNLLLKCKIIFSHKNILLQEVNYGMKLNNSNVV